MRLLLFGFGTVGQGLAEILRDKGDMLRAQYSFDAQLVGVVTARRGCLYRADGLDPTYLLDAITSGSFNAYPDTDELQRDFTPSTLVQSADYDVLVDATPSNLVTGGDALPRAYTALRARKHVVLANKGPVAVDYAGLINAAQKAGHRLLFEATVMAGTPSLRLAMEALAGCTITEARGIINGTTNYMLTQMEGGLSYPEALAQAQALGYAEADPTADVDGWDVAGKARILSAALFGRPITFDNMTVAGISQLTPADIDAARAAGERWKLIAHITRERASVMPMRIPLSHPLAGVAGATNALTLTTDLLGDVTLIGAGAGRLPTAFGLLSDLLALHRSG